MYEEYLVNSSSVAKHYRDHIAMTLKLNSLRPVGSFAVEESWGALST